MSLDSKFWITPVAAISIDGSEHEWMSTAVMLRLLGRDNARSVGCHAGRHAETGCCGKGAREMSRRKTKNSKCISRSDIIFWTIAGYAVYTAVLYWQRKPVCEYARKLCQQVGA